LPFRLFNIYWFKTAHQSRAFPHEQLLALKFQQSELKQSRNCFTARI